MARSAGRGRGWNRTPGSVYLRTVTLPVRDDSFVAVAALYCVTLVFACVVIGLESALVPVLAGLSFVAGLAVGRFWVLLVPLVLIGVVTIPLVAIAASSTGPAWEGAQKFFGPEVIVTLMGVLLAYVEAGMVMGVLAVKFLQRRGATPVSQ